MRAAVAEVYLPKGKIVAGTEPEPRISRAERVSMIDRHEPHILVLTTDAHYAQRIRGMIAPLVGTTSITQIEDFKTALQHLQRVDIVLVDVASLGGDWQHLVAPMVTRFQQVGWVAVIEADQSRLVEELCAYGVVDLLEKSATEKMTQMRLGNLLRLRQLEQDHQTLRAEQHEKSREMAELQRAMATMACNMERTTKEAEYRIFTQIRALVMPLFDEIASQTRGQLSEEPLNALRKYVNDLASGLTFQLQGRTSLSAQELRIALMVKNAMTSEQIAAHLHVSPETIKTHRRNIRRKFGLTSSNQKLRVYLQSLNLSETLGTERGEVATTPEI